MQKKLLYIMFPIVILWWIIYLWLSVYNNHKSRVGYTVIGEEYEIIDITPVHTWYNIKIINEKWSEFDNEEDCKKRAGKEDNRVCYNNVTPEDWVWFYMWDTEPRPVFKTYEECEDWAISMRPYSFLENAKWWVHVVEDWVTWCSQWCHYGYALPNEAWHYFCNKTIYSTRAHYDYFEKVFNKLEEWWNYERFENAFKSRAWCDIKLNTDGEPVYSYLVWIRFSYDLDERRAWVEKMTIKQKIKKDWKIFYVEQLEWLIYVRWEIFDNWVWKIYKIKDWDKKIIFPNTKQLLEDEKIEMDCHWSFNISPSGWKEVYSLPKDITWIDGWTIDNIYYRLYED